MIQLNNSVRCTEGVQGGFISSQIDDRTTETPRQDLTSVEILDYTLTNHINFEAEIHFAEEPGIIHIETFEVSLNAKEYVFMERTSKPSWIK